jgi:hypothetical protein
MNAYQRRKERRKFKPGKYLELRMAKFRYKLCAATRVPEQVLFAGPTRAEVLKKYGA